MPGYSNENLVFETPHGKQSLYFGNCISPSLLEGYDKILVVVDARIEHVPLVETIVNQVAACGNMAAVVAININNDKKSTSLMCDVLDAMCDHSMTRSSLLLSIGGGSTHDLAGVCASIFMRGVDYATVPTTFISMADGVIGKVAVNHARKKNMVGAFRSPRWSMINTDFINTSDPLEVARGLVEIWKHTILERDTEAQAKVQALLTSKEPISREELDDIIRWSMSVKYKYVKNDWHDKAGIHKALSLGHTLANIIEVKRATHHADAVFYGVLFEALMAERAGLLSTANLNHLLEGANNFERIFQLLPDTKVLLSKYLSPTELKQDKISEHGVIKFVVPTDHGYTIHICDEAALAGTLAAFEALDLEAVRSSYRPTKAVSGPVPELSLA